jgi:hypothetical protein
MSIQRMPMMMQTALFMRKRGYSERSIREITGLSERELLRWCALERLAQSVRPKAANSARLRT